MARKASSEQKLFLRRKRLGETQKQAAKHFGVSLIKYRQWELGQNTPDYQLEDPHITDVEWCVLERRKHNLTQEQLATKLGCCRWWIVCMETGKRNPGKLLRYWGQYNASC